MKRNGRVLTYVSRELLTDRELVMEAVRNDGIAINFASEAPVGMALTVKLKNPLTTHNPLIKEVEVHPSIKGVECPKPLVL